MGALDIMNWLKIYDYKNLDGFLRSCKGQGGLGESVLRVTAAHLISVVPSVLILLVYVFFASSTVALTGTGGLGLVSLIGGIGIAGVIGILILGIVMAIIFFLLNNGVIHVIAGMLGGKGKYADLCFLISYVSAALALGGIAFMAVGLAGTVIPCISCILLIVELVFYVYILYANYKVLVVNYGLSSGRAIATLVIDMLLWLVVYTVLIIVLIVIGVLSIASLTSLAGMAGALPKG